MHQQMEMTARNPMSAATTRKTSTGKLFMSASRPQIGGQGGRYSAALGTRNEGNGDGDLRAKLVKVAHIEEAIAEREKPPRRK
jgi:hypothetical protein